MMLLYCGMVFLLDEVRLAPAGFLNGFGVDYRGVV